MMNASGGTIWIGIGEKDSVAFHLEPIESAEKEKEKLYNHFVDKIEPAKYINTDAIKIELVPAGEQGHLLKITVNKRKTGDKPACLRKGEEGRLFVKRVGSRIRTLTYNEIFEIHDTANAASLQKNLGSVRKKLQLDLDQFLKCGVDALWMITTPLPSLEFDLHKNTEPRRLLEHLLEDPRNFGGRPHGYNLSKRYDQARMKLDSLRWGNDTNFF